MYPEFRVKLNDEAKEDNPNGLIKNPEDGLWVKIPKKVGRYMVLDAREEHEIIVNMFL